MHLLAIAVILVKFGVVRLVIDGSEAKWRLTGAMKSDELQLVLQETGTTPKVVRLT